jgi:hypothetical protein
MCSNGAMARELPSELIKHLIELGSSGRYDECGSLSERFPSTQSGAFMRLAPQAWYDVADALSRDELSALIKALTVVEHMPNCRAGSVSPVIWLFKRLSERSGDDLSELANWVLAHTDNEYLPFGSYNYGAKSPAELQDRREAAHRRAEACRSEEKKRQLDDMERKAAEATRKLFGALRRRDEKAIAALVRRGADIQAKDENGQSAIEMARSLGLSHFLTDGS